MRLNSYFVAIYELLLRYIINQLAGKSTHFNDISWSPQFRPLDLEGHSGFIWSLAWSTNLTTTPRKNTVTHFRPFWRKDISMFKTLFIFLGGFFSSQKYHISQNNLSKISHCCFGVKIYKNSIQITCLKLYTNQQIKHLYLAHSLSFVHLLFSRERFLI